MSPISSADSLLLRVREAHKADADAVSLLLGELGYPTMPLEARERVGDTLADPRSRLLVASLEATVAGLASICLVPYFPDGSSVLRLTALVVARRARRRRIGSTLVERVVELAGLEGISGVEVTTADTRPEAHAFYERLGFTKTSARFFLPAGS